MSNLYVRVCINQHRTAVQFGPAIAAQLRGLADQVESAVGPIDVTTDWPDIEAWLLPEEEAPDGPRLAAARLAAPFPRYLNPGRMNGDPGRMSADGDPGGHGDPPTHPAGVP
jgi:hypothetical protein